MNATMKRSIALASIVAPMMAMLFLCIAFLMGASHPLEESWFLVAKISDLPTDGTPILKTVSAKHFDAWSRLPDKPICDVFVRNSQDDTGVTVIHSWHNEAFKIPLRYDAMTRQFVSLGWKVAFDMQGNEVTDVESIPMNSNLARLPVRVVDGDVWVMLDEVRH